MMSIGVMHFRKPSPGFRSRFIQAIYKIEQGGSYESTAHAFVEFHADNLEQMTRFYQNALERRCAPNTP